MAVISAGLLTGCSAQTEPAPEQSAVSETSPPADPSSPAESITPEPDLEPCDLWDGPGDYLISCAITTESFSDFEQISFKGIERRFLEDRRVNGLTTDALVFEATYRCSPDTVDVLVNPEFSEEQASDQAVRFARIMGQMPIASRVGVREIHINAGNEVAAGGTSMVMFHTEYADAIGTWIEEVFLHEAAHTSLDYVFEGSVDEDLWAQAVSLDGKFVSQYAADYPDREDIAESHVAFIIRELSRDNERLLDSAAKVETLIPARLAYFESLGADFGPLSPDCG